MTDENTIPPANAPAEQTPPSDPVDSGPGESDTSARAALDRAFAAVDTVGTGPAGGDGDPIVPPEPEEFKVNDADAPGAETDAETDADQAKEGEEGEKPALSKFAEAPNRFSPDAKAAWEAAPEPVKAEIHRAVSELEEGIRQYQQIIEPLKPYMAEADKSGGSIESALQQYAHFNHTLAGDPAAALGMVFDYIGTSPQEWAASILGQEPDAAVAQQSQTIQQLQNQVSQLTQQLSGVQDNFQTSLRKSHERAAEAEINAFKDQPGHERFDELEAAIAKEIGFGYDLPQAYARAVMLNPSSEPAAKPAEPPQTPPQAPDDPTAQTRKEKGSLSVTGAPSRGSTPSSKKAPPSTRDALKNAFDVQGIR